MFSIKSVLNIAKLVPVLNSRNTLQTLKSTGAQARPSNSAPNPNASQGSSVTPQHVQSVAARVEKTSDVSSKITVTFQRNPQDYFFIDARVFVSGYKGNPAPVQVASGQSPVSFSLENTGEPMTVTVQASGSLGQAALSTAPTTTLRVVKTSLATTPTPGGGGPGGAVTLTMPVEFSVAGSPGTTLTVTKATEAANTIWSGPTTGADAAPTFRGLVTDDMPFALPFRSWHGWAAFGRANDVTNFAFACNPIEVGGTTPQAPTSGKPCTVRVSSANGINTQGYIFDNEGEATNNVTLGILNFYQWGCSINQTVTTRWWLGIFDGRSSPTNLKNDAPANNLVGFRFSTPALDTTWQCVTQTDATHQTITDTGLIMSTGYQIFRITYDVDTPAVNFFIDDLLVASHTTNIPDSAVTMMGFVSVTNPDTDGGTKSSTDMAFSHFEERPPSSLPLAP